MKQRKRSKYSYKRVIQQPEQMTEMKRQLARIEKRLSTSSDAESLKSINIMMTTLTLQMATVKDAANESAMRRGAIAGCVSGLIVSAAFSLLKATLGM
ncbi:MAG: hypothetical protein ACRC9O_09465 [Plesiomonas sp.]|uniref:hypothetical protein n=1 Tax=Plesiomonas sp. TaxID=2486279 RepID=UPI003F2C3465